MNQHEGPASGDAAQEFLKKFVEPPVSPSPPPQTAGFGPMGNAYGPGFEDDDPTIRIPQETIDAVDQGFAVHREEWDRDWGLEGAGGVAGDGVVRAPGAEPPKRQGRFRNKPPDDDFGNRRYTRPSI